jgi:hypothetical protein
MQADDGDTQRDEQREVLTQFGARRADRSGEKQQRHGVKQHHAIEDRNILWPEIAAPGRYEAEQEGHDHRKECAQNGL